MTTGIDTERRGLQPAQTKHHASGRSVPVRGVIGEHSPPVAPWSPANTPSLRDRLRSGRGPRTAGGMIGPNRLLAELV